MKTVFIISEYNPFHLGHEYMIRELRRELGDVCIVAIMSTSYVQRGEPAVFPPRVRAEAAVRCGVDLVLSLPFPYCAAGGKYFARAGVRIASAFSCDEAYLAFGSECGDIGILSAVAERMASDEFKKRLFSRDPGEPQAVASQRIFAEMYGEDDAKVAASPNNILAIEYITSIAEERSALIPYTLKRLGGGYKNLDTDVEFPSASALRKAFYGGDLETFYSGVPKEAAEVYRSAVESGRFSLGWDALSQVLLAKFRLARTGEFDGIAEFVPGLEGRFISAANSAKDADEFFGIAATKHYTNARLRRAALSALVGVLEFDISAPPTDVCVLASGRSGFDVINRVDRDRLNVITKASDYSRGGRGDELVLRSEALYDLSLSVKSGALDFMRFSPYIEK